MKTETRGRKRINEDLTVTMALAVSPELKEDMKDEARRAGKTLSQMGAYALQRWLNAQEHTRRIEGK